MSAAENMAGRASIKRLASLDATVNAAINGMYSVCFSDGRDVLVKARSHEAAERKASKLHPGHCINFSMDLLVAKIARAALASTKAVQS